MFKLKDLRNILKDADYMIFRQNETGQFIDAGKRDDKTGIDELKKIQFAFDCKNTTLKKIDWYLSYPKYESRILNMLPANCDAMFYIEDHSTELDEKENRATWILMLTIVKNPGTRTAKRADFKFDLCVTRNCDHKNCKEIKH